MPTTSHSAGQLESGVRIGDFEIERRLGAGGMGIVYKARQVSLDRVVALKVLGPALTRPADLDRFQREAKAAARLQHPGIAAIHFIGQDAEVCYHVMEYVDGVPLQRVIERLGRSADAVDSPDTVVAAELTTQPAAPVVRFDGPTTVDAAAESSAAPTGEYEPRGDPVGGTVSAGGKRTRRGAGYVRRCCEIVRDVARALEYAHAAGVIHRDIKPENLMLDQAGQVRVIDFGLARYFDDESITRTGQLLGTPLYMSPEQVTGRFRLDRRTDIYSLGLVLYELLALRRPFEASSREALLRNVVTKALPPLGGRNPELPKELEAVAHKATSKDPEERYQTAAEFARDLDAFLAGKPVAAPPYRYRIDFQDVLARRPAGVVLASFITLLLGCTVFVGLACVSAMMLVIADGGTGTTLVSVVQFSAALMVLGVTVGLARGLLAGRNWVRWMVAGLSALGILGLLFVGGLMGVMLAAQSNRAEQSPDSGVSSRFVFGMMAMYAIPLVLAMACLVVSVTCLLRAKVRAWFRLAGQARQEYAELLRSLSE